MRVCPKCGKELDNKALFCIKCGSKQEHKCSSCGAELIEGAAFCIKCGKPKDHIEIKEEQNSPQAHNHVLTTEKKSNNNSSILTKIAIAIVTVVAIAILVATVWSAFYDIYKPNKNSSVSVIPESNQNLVKLKLDRGVSISIPKDWDIVSKNEVNKDMPHFKNLLRTKYKNEKNGIYFSIISEYKTLDNIFKFKNITQEDINEETDKSFYYSKIINKNKLRQFFPYTITKTGICKYPSIYNYQAYSNDNKGNEIHYSWIIRTMNQTIHVNLYYDMDKHLGNNTCELVTKIILPSLTVE